MTSAPVRWMRGVSIRGCLATTINYLDRAVLGVLAPTLRDEIGWSDQDYGVISAAALLIMHLLVPRLEPARIDV